MEITLEKIHIDDAANTASIDTTKERVIYIVENGQVEAVPLPPYGTLEISCQNYKIHNLSYRQTIKRK